MKKRYKIAIGLSASLALISSAVVLSSCSSTNVNTNINEQTKYILNNQLQLHFKFTPNVNYIYDIISKLLSKNNNNQIVKKIYDDVVEQIMDPKSEIRQPIDLYLNGWVLDYNYKTKEYYISTSSITEKLKYSLSNSENKNVPKYLFTFPVDPTTVCNDSSTHQELQLFIKTNDLNEEIKINSVNHLNIDRMINQFAFTARDKEPLAQYDLLLHIPKDEYDNSVYGVKQAVDPTNNVVYKYKKIVPNFEVTKRENKAISWSYLKFTWTPDNPNQTIPSCLDLSSKYVDKNSTYLSKLLETYNLLQEKNFNRQEFLKIFPFATLKKNEEYSTAGYFNTKKFNRIEQITSNSVGLLKGSKKKFSVFNNKGELSVVPYDYMSGMSLDFKNQKISLSGAMIVNKNNQIVGINCNSVDADNSVYSIFIPFYTDINYIYSGVKPFEILYKYTLTNKDDTILNRIFTSPNFIKTNNI